MDFHALRGPAGRALADAAARNSDEGVIPGRSVSGGESIRMHTLWISFPASQPPGITWGTHPRKSPGCAGASRSHPERQSGSDPTQTLRGLRVEEVDVGRID